MTYCVGALLESGLILASDTRTNAGVDHIATVRKMTVFERLGDRVVVLLSAGNLAITQSTVNILQERHREEHAEGNVFAAPTMFRAARAVGEALREVYELDAADLRKHQTDFSASFIIGGQIGGEPPRLFMVYSAGNCIEATSDTPYLQIGETKYGKPVLDRLITPGMTLGQAAKCVLVSYNSTMRSNVSVGLPIDLVVYRKNSLRIESKVAIDAQDPYFTRISRDWSSGLQKVFDRLPDPKFAATL